jgi:hypothetical protein
MYCLENLTVPVQSAVHTQERRHFSNALQVFPANTVGDGDYEILTRINEYNRRDLSFQADALNAFRGVLECFELREQDPIHHFLGLPLYPMDP